MLVLIKSAAGVLVGTLFAVAMAPAPAPQICNTITACVATNIVTCPGSATCPGSGCPSYTLSGITTTNGACACGNAGLPCVEQGDCVASATLSVSISDVDSWRIPGGCCLTTSPAQIATGVSGRCDGSVSLELWLWVGDGNCSFQPTCKYRLTSTCGADGCSAATGC